MPDKAKQRVATAASTGAAPAHAVTRRALLKVGAAGVVLASLRGLEVSANPLASTRMLNRGSVAEFDGLGAGTSVLTSFRNSATEFEWVTPGEGYAPTLQYSDGTRLSWQPRPLQ